jgi:hypothetical protein
MNVTAGMFVRPFNPPQVRTIPNLDAGGVSKNKYPSARSATVEDDSDKERVYKIHTYQKRPTSPSYCINVRQLPCRVRGDGRRDCGSSDFL